jgi:hypothetical protein
MPTETLYRRIAVEMVTRLDDGTVLWPDQVRYEPVDAQQIVSANHPRCPSCQHFGQELANTFWCHKKHRHADKDHYCSNHSSLTQESNKP